MASTTVHVRPELVEQVRELAQERGVSPEIVVSVALRQFLQAPPSRFPRRSEVEPPETYTPSVARVHRALVAAWDGITPVLSPALADAVGIHRGNVDRHLATLRELGYAYRPALGAGHVPLVAAPVAAQEVPQAS